MNNDDPNNTFKLWLYVILMALSGGVIVWLVGTVAMAVQKGW